MVRIRGAPETKTPMSWLRMIVVVLLVAGHDDER
jgi:hypothetical protein